jgi:hypothetical protein
MDSIKARENININGGDDVDDDSPMEPCPTRREVFKALSTIGKCCWAGMFRQWQTLRFAYWLAQSLGSFAAQPLDVQRSGNS